jgi:hypothetical protein
MAKLSVYAIIAGIVLFISANGEAGVYSDDLSRCLVESSTSSDKLVLVKWMFTAMSLHPAVKSIASVSAKQLDDSNKETSELFIKLITETCKGQTIKAITYEGAEAIQSSFTVFGQVAAKELFSNPDVAAGMAGLEKYMDAKQLQKTLGVGQ